jgi:hypothetical protein
MKGHRRHRAVRGLHHRRACLQQPAVDAAKASPDAEVRWQVAIAVAHLRLRELALYSDPRVVPGCRVVPRPVIAGPYRDPGGRGLEPKMLASQAHLRRRDAGIAGHRPVPGGALARDRRLGRKAVLRQISRRCAQRRERGWRHEVLVVDAVSDVVVRVPAAGHELSRRRGQGRAAALVSAVRPRRHRDRDRPRRRRSATPAGSGRSPAADARRH